MGAIIPLGELTRADAGLAGAKAANLGELLRAGFPVPDGFVVLGEPTEALSAHLERLGDRAWAVRSSGAAEDLSGASFAGQYETVLNVRGREALIAAIHRCRDSAALSRVTVYREARAQSADSHFAVLIQQMLQPEAAGVAFTANPLTGDRGEVVISAARGLGERVVSGEAVGDEWTVRDGRAICFRSIEHAITEEQANAVAELSRRVERQLGGPQDIEWAIEKGQLYLLQARPMTALPPAVEWKPPSDGPWVRNFRLGEWLPEAMTPLFSDWLLPQIERGYLVGMKKTIGAEVPFRYGVVNGWYYTAPPRNPPLVFLRAAIQSRGRVFSLIINGLYRVSRKPDIADRKLLGHLAEEWRNSVLPSYRQLVTTAEAAVGAASAEELTRWIDELGSMAGEVLWSLAIVGGSAWKMEACLARFLSQHLPAVGGSAAPTLLSALRGVQLDPVPPHAVQSVDWFRPTAGEGTAAHTPCPPERLTRGIAAREQTESACRSGFADRPERLARFEVLLEVARRYALLREEQAGLLTLAWPALRRCVGRLAELAISRGVIQQREDAFFLTRAELLGDRDCCELSQTRRAEWERQRKLIAPLMIGRASKLFERSIRSVVDAVRLPQRHPENALIGHPASPGRASGTVRLIHGPEDFELLAEGDVLVAKGTAPAWTPLFARAAAVVTDTGSLAAHASLVAREYGIPAVVGTGNATTRLRDGQVVTVDGSAGVVELT